MLRAIFLHTLCVIILFNCSTLNFIYCTGWLHNLGSVPVLQTTTRAVINYHVFWWHDFSVVCKGRTQVSFASVSLFSSRATPCDFRHVYAGSLQEAACSQLQALDEAVFNPRVIIRKLQP